MAVLLVHRYRYDVDAIRDGSVGEFNPLECSEICLNWNTTTIRYLRS